MRLLTNFRKKFSRFAQILKPEKATLFPYPNSDQAHHIHTQPQNIHSNKTQ